MQNHVDTDSKFHKFSTFLAQMGEAGVGNSIFSLGTESGYQLQYIPFEHVNRDAQLVIVGITPGMNQLRLAYEAAKVGLNANWGDEKTLEYIKQQGAFGGSAMRPNLLKMLRHFDFERLLANSGPSWTLIPAQAGQQFQGKLDADSSASWTAQRHNVARGITVAPSAILQRTTWPTAGYPCARYLKYYGYPLKVVAATGR